MHADTSPGMNGLNPRFYQRFWDVVGRDIVQSCRDWFNTCVFPNNLNDTLIVLIPKVEDPEAVKDFQPISLCNVFYKVFAKVLANRLKTILPNLISLSQSAFVPGRLISDNVLIAFKLIHSMKTRMTGRQGASALKVDISKAYDRVNWCYLRAVMQGLGFSQRWVDLVMLCVSSVKYWVGVNGDEVGPIIPERGLRQGCPLSPHLFILYVEGLSKLFSKSEREVTYEAASGQAVNWQKSGIFFSSNTYELDKTAVTGVFGVIAPLNHGRYLGLPSLIGRERRRIFSFLKDRVRKLVNGWNQKLLSKAGKEVLIKAVAQAIPSFCMSSFLIPVSILVELQRQMNSYWWGGKMRWLSWDRLCVAKEEGDLGFRHLRSFNLALLGKHCWRLLHNTNSLFYSSFKSKYFPSGNFLGAGVGRNPSFVWRGICAAKDAICSGFEHIRVFDLILAHGTRAWNLPLIHGLFNPSIAEIITSIPLSTIVQDDILIWHWTDSGIYSVKSGYRLLASQNVDTADAGRSTYYWEHSQLSYNCWNIFTRHGRTNFFESFVMGLWSVWLSRNELKWNQVEEGPYQVVTRARSMLASWQKAQRTSPGSGIGPGTPVSSQWLPPLVGTLKINFDATLHPSIGYGAVGAVISNCNRGFVSTATSSLQGCSSLAVVEAQALRTVLSWLLSGYSNLKIQIETDCLQVYCAMRNSVQDWSEFGIVISEYKLLLVQLPNVTLAWIRRQANDIAHVLAKLVPHGACFQTWDIVPTCIARFFY
ncbi:uncharacterized protein LOC105631710 [Jatropha curcas]|uniref:uncharacterized protein LOC105631710 n=1 Tax=Jatropha curcas TaxID=180498 RepID=UPI0005FB4D80|nr:uncharacterized protein LOC105631710 [Jatropha curcas]